MRMRHLWLTVKKRSRLSIIACIISARVAYRGEGNVLRCTALAFSSGIALACAEIGHLLKTGGSHRLWRATRSALTLAAPLGIALARIKYQRKSMAKKKKAWATKISNAAQETAGAARISGARRTIEGRGWAPWPLRTGAHHKSRCTKAIKARKSGIATARPRHKSTNPRLDICRIMNRLGVAAAAYRRLININISLMFSCITRNRMTVASPLACCRFSHAYAIISLPPHAPALFPRLLRSCERKTRAKTHNARTALSACGRATRG